MANELFSEAMDLVSLYIQLEDNLKPLRVRQKSLHFLEAYEALFGKFRGCAPSVLEIGCGYPASTSGLENDMGGSLKLWSKWFGKGTRVTGIDIIPECRKYADEAEGISVEIGSQDDEDFLSSVARKYGPFDIIIDDGSHIDSHIEFSFFALFPYLRNGGYYAIEDINDHVKSGHSFVSKDRFIYKCLGLVENLQKYSEMVHLQQANGLLDYQPNNLSSMDVGLDAVHFYRDLICVCKRFREKSVQMPMPPHYFF